MNNLARFTVSNPIYGWILILACLVGGIHGIQNIGRLEDPDFPIKVAYIITSYPGATAEEVEMEVTDRIEASLQELPQIDFFISKSVPGRSEIEVRLLEHFDDTETPQVFDELRRRVREAEMWMPPGVETPLVEDDFADVYGILYSATAQGYTNAELQDMAKDTGNRLKQVEGVAKVGIRGLQQEAIYVEFDDQRLTALGLSIDDISQSIWAENQVVDAGSAKFDGRRLMIAQRSKINGVEALARMKIGMPGSTEIIRLSDIATVKRTGVEVPHELVRLNGKPAAVISISVTPGLNVVEVGEQVDAKLREIQASLPLGIEVAPIYKQHDVVQEAINNFLKNLGISVFTVMLALMLFMGWRAGTVVGAVLLLTVLGTIEVMYFMEIELQRISLGALMIAMGMLVDNAIVIAEGMVVGVRRGLDAKEAAVQSVARTQYALLGATIIGILAFAPISLSDDNSGHFLISLFQVVAISLLLSWLLAITVIPLLGNYLLKPTTALSEAELYRAWYFRPYHWMISFGLRRAWFTSTLIICVTVACLYSMQFVKTAFFPTNNTPLFYVDYRLQEGTDITTTSADVAPLEQALMQMEGITSVASFVGRGAPRFTAIQSPEQPNSAYTQLIVRVDDIEKINRLMEETKVRFAKLRPDAEIQIRRAEFSPSSGSKIEMRYSGPDPAILRDLADQTLAIYLKHNLIDRKTNWRPQALQLVPEFNESNARLAGVSRQDLAKSLAYNTHGLNIGLVRDQDKLIPIIARAPDAERTDLEGLKDRQVWSATQRQFVPITQIVSRFSLQAENTTIYRRDRIRTLTAQGDQPIGHNVNQYFVRVKDEVEAIKLPPGYTREWGGEFESNKMANESLSQRMPLAFGLMFFITILMFGSMKQPIVIWLTVPMIMCGVALGLLITDLPLTFPSFLGVLSLSGMLIKNCIVLVDEIDKRLKDAPNAIETMIMASLSRLRPVMLASLTTVFGMSPLLTDAFFREMAVCIMSGLIFATLLTLIAVPVFYRIALGSRITEEPVLT
ncbi:MAG: efflux RND transporter permease subunit [Pseudomonadales bacterium]|nr:efflux RND transporter permease subunit [Pseudomonadales bacterium]MBO6594899.1 efflux RND transporter permease subunit [Pseudomonadales bacterium]MBO6821541.1 efflux RND transporter permease subunit [Pseudomonadales bacterium]